MNHVLAGGDSSISLSKHTVTFLTRRGALLPTPGNIFQPESKLVLPTPEALRPCSVKTLVRNWLRFETNRYKIRFGGVLHAQQRKIRTIFSLVFVLLRCKLFVFFQAKGKKCSLRFLFAQFSFRVNLLQIFSSVT